MLTFGSMFFMFRLNARFGKLSVYLFYSGCSLLQGLVSARLSQNVVKRMRKELFGKLMEVPVRYLDTHSHGDVMSRMTNDIENISTTVSQSLPSLFSGVLTIIGTVMIMLWYCWQLALLSFASVLLTLIATKVLSKMVRKRSGPQPIRAWHLMWQSVFKFMRAVI